jgi:GNAT superfamily N-acetyltransferase
VEVNGEVVATAMGALRDSTPSPSAPVGGDVLVNNISTDARARRQGHARSALHAVLRWCATTGAGHAELMATDAGYSMYETAGFYPVALDST